MLSGIGRLIVNTLAFMEIVTFLKEVLCLDGWKFWVIYISFVILITILNPPFN